jgi:hypothetical protein
LKKRFEEPLAILKETASGGQLYGQDKKRKQIFFEFSRDSDVKRIEYDFDREKN